MAWFGGGIDAATAQRILKNQYRIEQKLDALLAAFAIESEVPVHEASPLGPDAEQRAVDAEARVSDAEQRAVDAEQRAVDAEQRALTAEERAAARAIAAEARTSTYTS